VNVLAPVSRLAGMHHNWPAAPVVCTLLAGGHRMEPVCSAWPLGTLARRSADAMGRQTAQPVRK
jgi:hypothetical protein